MKLACTEGSEVTMQMFEEIFLQEDAFAFAHVRRPLPPPPPLPLPPACSSALSPVSASTPANIRVRSDSLLGVH